MKTWRRSPLGVTATRQQEGKQDEPLPAFCVESHYPCLIGECWQIFSIRQVWTSPILRMALIVFGSKLGGRKRSKTDDRQRPARDLPPPYIATFRSGIGSSGPTHINR